MSRHTEISSRVRLCGRGFSLVELIVMIVLLAIISAVAIPRFANAASSQLGEATRTMGREILYARDRAMSTGTTHWVSINVSSSTYTLMVDNSASPGFAGATTITDPGTRGSFTRTLNQNELAGITMQSAFYNGTSTNITGFGFSRFGALLTSAGAASTARLDITLRGPGSSPPTAVVTVQPVTGAVTWP